MCGTKKCYKCKIEKSLEEFGNLKSSKDGKRYDCKTCRKEFNIVNKERKKEYNQKYWIKNKNTVGENNKNYRDNNQNQIFEQRKQYRENNKDHIKQKMIDYKPIRNMRNKIRRKTDPQFRISETLKSKIHKVLKGIIVSNKTNELIGCSKDFLMNWLEYQFNDTMSWDNYGKEWHIDHVIAVNTFDMENESDVKICFNWKNLQPLGGFDNQSKSDKFMPYMVYSHMLTLNNYININNLYKEYQGLIERLIWLRKNSGMVKISKDITMENPQPTTIIQ